MNRLHIATRGAGTWKERLVNPSLHWKREYSAFETAVSWELASKSKSGLPLPIHNLFVNSGYDEPTLIYAVAEHRVDLPPGAIAPSQCDVWAVVKTSSGMLSLSVEAKAGEAFGDAILEKWLSSGDGEHSKNNREIRWDYVRLHLPKSDLYEKVRFQILHRCAASVIEAKRLGFQHAAFVVQAFNTPDVSFQDYALFCKAVNLPAARGTMAKTSVNGISLGVGWADCALATDADVAAAV
jgi:hypothetical protein